MIDYEIKNEYDAEVQNTATAQDSKVKFSTKTFSTIKKIGNKLHKKIIEKKIERVESKVRNFDVSVGKKEAKYKVADFAEAQAERLAKLQYELKVLNGADREEEYENYKTRKLKLRDKWLDNVFSNGQKIYISYENISEDFVNNNNMEINKENLNEKLNSFQEIDYSKKMEEAILRLQELSMENPLTPEEKQSASDEEKRLHEEIKEAQNHLTEDEIENVYKFTRKSPIVENEETTVAEPTIEEPIVSEPTVEEPIVYEPVVEENTVEEKTELSKKNPVDLSNLTGEELDRRLDDIRNELANRTNYENDIAGQNNNEPQEEKKYYTESEDGKSRMFDFTVNNEPEEPKAEEKIEQIKDELESEKTVLNQIRNEISEISISGDNRSIPENLILMADKKVARIDELNRKLNELQPQEEKDGDKTPVEEKKTEEEKTPEVGKTSDVETKEEHPVEFENIDLSNIKNISDPQVLESYKKALQAIQKKKEIASKHETLKKQYEENTSKKQENNQKMITLFNKLAMEAEGKANELEEENANLSTMNASISNENDAMTKIIAELSGNTQEEYKPRTR